MSFLSIILALGCPSPPLTAADPAGNPVEAPEQEPATAEGPQQPLPGPQNGRAGSGEEQSLSNDPLLTALEDLRSGLPAECVLEDDCSQSSGLWACMLSCGRYDLPAQELVTAGYPIELTRSEHEERFGLIRQQPYLGTSLHQNLADTLLLIPRHHSDGSITYVVWRDWAGKFVKPIGVEASVDYHLESSADGIKFRQPDGPSRQGEVWYLLRNGARKGEAYVASSLFNEADTYVVRPSERRLSSLGPVGASIIRAEGIPLLRSNCSPVRSHFAESGLCYGQVEQVKCVPPGTAWPDQLVTCLNDSLSFRERDGD